MSRDKPDICDFCNTKHDYYRSGIEGNKVTGKQNIFEVYFIELILSPQQ